MHLKALFREKVHSVHIPIHKHTRSKAPLSRIKCRLSCYLLLSFFFLLTQHFFSTVLFPASLPSQEREAGRQERGCSFGLSFSFQLPYLMDGKNRLTQSNAILRYIARKHNMCEWGRAGVVRAAHLGMDKAKGDFLSFGLQAVTLKRKGFEWTSWRTK